MARRQSLAGLLHHRTTPGPWDAITDVPGVAVGHSTVRQGGVNTGVSALVTEQLITGGRHPAAVAVGNGHGKFIGSTQIDELGEVETPILLTNTLAAFRVADALLSWLLESPAHARTTSLNPVVGECNDSILNDIRNPAIQASHVRQALDHASSGPVEQGCVGAGAGMAALGFKGGIGTASRRVTGTSYFVGVLALTNFTGRLRVGDHLASAPEPASFPGTDPLATPRTAPGNSCVMLTVTDAPLDARRLARVARRTVYTLGKVGSDFAQGSGDYALAMSVAAPGPSVSDRSIDPIFLATTEAAEAALVRSVLRARDTTGFRDQTRRAVRPADLGLDRFPSDV